MLKVQPKKIQTAQGMVEFALVLPILLLLILGIFAFGHLFFSYSSVVSASRDAARWGSAVGVSENLLPRYRDCDSIRATAQRSGGFAGITTTNIADPDDVTTPGIYIGFDRGPNDPEPDYDDCADGDGPNDVGSGDRINVRVTITYHSIVPLINIPTFPLTATTSRTIVHSLVVGDPADAEPSCVSTIIQLEYYYQDGEVIVPSPVVGAQIFVSGAVLGANAVHPQGTLEIFDETFDGVYNDPLVDHYCQITLTGTETGLVACDHQLVPLGAYAEAGVIHHISAIFTSTGDPAAIPCYRDQRILEDLLIIKANTEVVIDRTDPNPSNYPGELVTVDVTVRPDTPGAGYPSGQVTIFNARTNEVVCNIISLAPNILDPLITSSSGACTFAPLSDVTLFAVYAGDDNFNISPPSVYYDHQVTAPPVDTCPYVVSGSIQPTLNGGQLEIFNELGAYTTIQRIRVEWPELLSPNLTEIRFGVNGFMNSCTTTGNAQRRNCLWQYTPLGTGLPPPEADLTEATSSAFWDERFAGLDAGERRQLRLVFTGGVPSGDYTLHISFANGCEIDAGPYNFAP